MSYYKIIFHYETGEEYSYYIPEKMVIPSTLNIMKKQENKSPDFACKYTLDFKKCGGFEGPLIDLYSKGITMLQPLKKDTVMELAHILKVFHYQL